MAKPSAAPAGCTLPTAELPLRLAEFDDLFTEHLDAIERPGPTHARLLLRGEDGLAQTVRDLTDREAACCSFFGFSGDLESLGEGAEETVRLDIVVHPERLDVLDGLIAWAAAKLRRAESNTNSAT